jgi:hypothetical protein
MILAYIRAHRYYSRVEKRRDGSYLRTTQHGPGSRRVVEVVSGLEAARLCAYGDWVACDALREARGSEHPYQAILAELEDL